MSEVIRGMPLDEYLALDRWSFHRLSCYRDSPQTAIHGPPPDNEGSRALIVGRAFHAAVLEPQIFSKVFGLAPVNERTGAPYGVDTRAALACEHVCLTEAEMRMVTGMADFAIDAWHRLADIEDDDRELTVLFEVEGVECKARIDAMTEEVIVDLKSCRDVRYATHDARRYWYDGQMAFYRMAVGRDMEASLLFTQKSYPHLCAEVRVSRATMDEAEWELRELLQEIKGGGSARLQRTVPSHVI